MAVRRRKKFAVFAAVDESAFGPKRSRQPFAFVSVIGGKADAKSFAGGVRRRGD
jgi:hypothetical protein